MTKRLSPNLPLYERLAREWFKTDHANEDKWEDWHENVHAAYRDHARKAIRLLKKVQRG